MTDDPKRSAEQPGAEKRGSSPHVEDSPEGRVLWLERAYERQEERWELVSNQLSNLFDRLNRLRCDEHATLIKTMDDRGTRALGEAEQRIAGLEAQMALISSGSGRAKTPSSEQWPRTGGGHPAVSQHDLEDSRRIVLAELEGTVERTVEDRLRAVEEAQERRGQQRRAAVKDWLQIVKIVVGIAAGVGFGATLTARCGPLASPTPTEQRARLREALSAPAKPDMSIHGATRAVGK